MGPAPREAGPAGQRDGGAQLPEYLREYARRFQERLEKLRADAAAVEIDEDLADGADDRGPENPIHEQLSADVGLFATLCGFSTADFAELYGPLHQSLSRTRRGRRPAIGPMDSFLLLLHWLRSGQPFVMIAAGFRLNPQTVHRRVMEVAELVHGPLVARFITPAARTAFPAEETLPDCGLVVDATVQNRGRPVGPFEEARRYDSGKHCLDCLKSQVVTNRRGAAVLVVAGIPGAVHDMMLFREHVGDVEALIAGHEGEPVHVLADKGDIGVSGSARVVLVTPARRPAGGWLTRDQLRANATIGSARVIVENFFGRLKTKFRILAGRWAQREDLYPTIFEVCCALVNYAIRSGGGSPLRAEEGRSYLQALTLEVQAARAAESRRRASRRAALARRLDRLRPGEGGDPGSPPGEDESGDPPPVGDGGPAPAGGPPGAAGDR
jgi:hypothetical protein